MPQQTDSPADPGQAIPLPASSSAADVGAMPGVLVEFAPFTATHLATALACLAVIAAVVIAGRRSVRGSSPEQRACDAGGQVLGVVGLVNWLCVQAWWNIPVRFDLEVSLPLQVCDLAGPITAIALITGRRSWTTLSYFGAFALSTQAFFTPIVKTGPIFTEFWLFWETHTFLVGGAVYLVCVRGYRPALRDLLFAALCLTGYVFTLLPFNIAFGLNYGFLGNTKPENPTLIDKIGPWPWRLIPMAALAFTAMAITWLPWAILRRVQRDRLPEPQ